MREIIPAFELSSSPKTGNEFSPHRVPQPQESSSHVPKDSESRAEPAYFLIVGAQRTGTTYLYHVLDEHPEIEMAKPVRPEPKFFLIDELYEHGLPHYERTYFTGKPGAWLRGEKSVSYMESEKCARRIAQHLPTAKLIFLLRNPIDRAVSHYYFSVENGLETLPMAEAFRRESERLRNFDRRRVSVSPYAYLQRGCYIDSLRMWERFFPRAQIKILVQERFIESQESVSALYGFLEVRSSFCPSMLHERINAGPPDLPPLEPGLRRYLRDYFADPNARLMRHLGFEVEEWGEEEF